MFSTAPSHCRSGREPARGLDDLERLLDALEGEVLGLGRDQRVVGGDERVDGQQPERRRAVDQDQVVFAARPRRARAAGPSRGRSCRSAAARPRRGGCWRAERRRGSRRRPRRVRRARRRASARRRRRRRSSRSGCPAGRCRRPGRAGPTRRKTSTSVRVVVVLPVPPFCERTVIVVAIGGDDAEAVGGLRFRLLTHACLLGDTRDPEVGNVASRLPAGRQGKRSLVSQWAT